MPPDRPAQQDRLNVNVVEVPMHIASKPAPTEKPVTVKNPYKSQVPHNDYVASIEQLSPKLYRHFLPPKLVGSHRGKFNFRHGRPVNDCALRHRRVLFRTPRHPQRKEKESQIS